MKALSYLIFLITENFKLNVELEIDMYNILHYSIFLRNRKCKAKLITH